MNLVVVCRKSEKTGNNYHVLCMDMGYRLVNLSMDRSVITEIANITYHDLYSLGVGQVFEIGTVATVKK